MIDFSRIDNESFKLADLQGEVSHGQLLEYTHASINTVLALIAGARDEYVSFLPHDPEANDPFAEDPALQNIGWTLGHVIVHMTASGEETAAIGAALARGVEVSWRMRYEVPWESVTTLAQCRHRLEESRRMRVAALNSWPDAPHLEILWTKVARFGPLNAIGYSLLGLKHDSDHYGQIAEIMRQGREKFG
jgi:hypothetical protein